MEQMKVGIIGAGRIAKQIWRKHWTVWTMHAYAIARKKS